MSKARRRTEVLNAEFVDGYAAGWCFGVHEAFRANLDISLDTRVDRAANEALAARLGRKPTAAERITRKVSRFQTMAAKTPESITFRATLPIR